MAITYGDHLIDSGHYDITPEQEREIEARKECERRGLDPDDDACDGATVWMVVDQEMRQMRDWREESNKAHAKLTIAVEALRAIHGCLWRDNEPYDERIGDLKSLALAALTEIAGEPSVEAQEYDTMLATGVIPPSLQHRFYPQRGPDCACCERQPRKDCDVPGCTNKDALWALP